MKRHLLVIFALWSLTLLSFSTRAHAASAVTCARSTLGIPAYWLQEKPILLKTESAGLQPITLSIDSEFDIGSAIRRVRRHEDIWAQLVPHMPSRRYAFIRDAVKLSDAQMKMFVLRRGTDITQPVSLANVQPAYFHAVLNHQPESTKHGMAISNMRGQNLFEKILVSMREVAARDYQVPTTIKDEPVGITTPEMCHQTYQTSPREFYDFVNRWHEDVPDAMTHFHIGLENEAIGFRQGAAIARAVEARIVLANATQDPASPGRIAAVNGASNFIATAEKFFESGKGVVRFGTSRHIIPPSDPENGWARHAHDLEIRHYLNLAHGINEVAFVMQMAENFERIETSVLAQYADEIARDVSWGYVAHALNYVGLLMKLTAPVGSPEAARAERVLALAHEVSLEMITRDVGSEIDLSLETRRRVHQLVKSEALLSRLTPAFFLRPSR